MSKFTQSQRASILAEARANIAKRNPSPRQSEELVYKRRDNAAVGSSPARAPSESSAWGSSELPWWEWVDKRIDASLEAHGEEIGTAIGDFCGPQFAALKRQIELLEREVTQLREQVALERGLRDLRTEVEVARREVPKIPEIAARLEREQGRLQRELESTQQKLKRTRVDQRIADYQLNKLREATEARSAAVEMKFETTVSSFRMHEMIHPDAGAALRDFAAATLKGNKAAPTETIWVLPGPPGR